MAKGGFDDFEMQDLGQKYPRYDEMNNEELDNEYQNLSKESSDLLLGDVRLDDVKKRISYVDRIRENRNNETSFIYSDDGETAKITTRKGGRSQSAPEIELHDTTTRPENETIPAIEKFISDNYTESFRFNMNSVKVLELRNRLNKTNNNNITLKPITTRNKMGVEKIVLKRNSKGLLQYNDAEGSQKAVDQFKELINDIIEDQTDREKTEREMPMVDTESNKLEWENEFDTIDPKVIPGLTPKETTEVHGVLFSSKSIDPTSRIGPDGMLQKQIDHISETIGYTERELDRTSDPELRQALEERIYGLNEARELTARQKILEETRYQQEEDITRLQRFNKWAKENLVGPSALAISVAGIITTIIVDARKALIKGAQATGKFAKAVYNLGKKLGALLAPILNVIAQALSWGAKGLAWLSKTLWLLALAVAWFIYDQYKERRKWK